LPPRSPCDEGSEFEQEQERELREAFSDAFESGRYCPNLSSSQRRQVMLDRDLDWYARWISCIAPSSSTWSRVGRTPLWGWVLLDTPSLEDAKKALLDADQTKLCEEAERTPFRFIGVGHLSDVWSVVISPGFPEDMQNP
jgi:hypothetical protein